jgi:chromosome segregation ATPase
LEQTILSLQLEKDELNAQIQTLGNTTSSQLATITSLQGDTTLDVKIAELESQIVTLTNANVTATATITQLNANVVSASDTSILDSKITNLESQVVTLTSERDEWKQLANNWYAVAMEQLKVMINVLGL